MIPSIQRKFGNFWDRSTH